ncbi:lipoprotein-releasing system permease protein [Salinimicrobium catena]|uniref:Lipoprotein-releasing system permease protein n=1 Tax=Salinimicrobium catena TaxID=390640 RepID=A0A1H5INT7_9FLAO|nr:FtsX-like permease family protein [Salinimicrobium catena]SDK79127.1 lipoprotein-releasing system permease protein [Salinimicrobium catena]SEE41777.1 lipoprotein-releasing system permease protein [Salinimicrobium catena]
MNFPFYIARRYLFSKSSNNAINIITFIAAIGVFAGAFSLFIVLSGFTGLKDFSLSFSNKYDPDLKVLPESGKTFNFSSEEAQRLQKIEGLQKFSEVIEERVFLNFKSKNKTAYIKGVDENYLRVNQLDSALVIGAWFVPGESQVVIGNTISRELSLGPFDYSGLLEILVPRPGTGQVTDPTNAFNSENAVVSGIYSINEDLDDKFVFSDISFARDLLDLKPNELSALELKLSPTANVEMVQQAVRAAIDDPVQIKNRAQLNDALYKMLNTENLAVYLIFTLVLIIALFNVVGSIIMVILDKRENIKTLHSLGATPVQIRNIFFAQGVFMTLLGGVIGLGFSILLVMLQLEYQLVMITPSLAYPVAITFENILIVLLTIGALGTLASWIAASRSKKALG